MESIIREIKNVGNPPPRPVRRLLDSLDRVKRMLQLSQHKLPSGASTIGEGFLRRDDAADMICEIEKSVGGFMHAHPAPLDVTIRMTAVKDERPSMDMFESELVLLLADQDPKQSDKLIAGAFHSNGFCYAAKGDLIGWWTKDENKFHQHRNLIDERNLPRITYWAKFDLKFPDPPIETPPEPGDRMEGMPMAKEKL